MAACSLPVAAIAQDYGRRSDRNGVRRDRWPACALAIVLDSFWLFGAATFFGGSYAAVLLSFRFAAADCVPPKRRPRVVFHDRQRSSPPE